MNAHDSGGAELGENGGEARQRRRHRTRQDRELSLVLLSGIAADAPDVGGRDQVEREAEVERDRDVPAGEQPRREPPVRHERRRGDHDQTDRDRGEEPRPNAHDPEQQRRTAMPGTHAANISSSTPPARTMLA